jgi:LmbE family N-acetylglucosaminyl deacetylase
MCVTAHPDDESASFGGALLMAHERGVDTTVICLTEGTAASNRGDAQSNEELGAARRAEMAAACELLQVTRYEVWKYPDSALMETNLRELATRLVERMRTLRPHVVLTYGGDGGPNLHRDHAVAGFAATAAFHWSGRSNFAPDQLERGLKLWTPYKLYYESAAYTISKFTEEAAIAPRVPPSLVLQLGSHQQQKQRALELHHSQGLMARAADTFKKYGHEEQYLLAAARHQQPSGQDNDISAMFAGIDDEDASG